MKEKKKAKNSKLIVKIMLLAILAMVVSNVILTITSVMELSSTYKDQIEEALLTGAVQMDALAENSWDGDWGYDDAKGLTKGDQAVTEDYENTMNGLKKQTGLDYTIFYDKTRRATTLTDESGKSLNGTDAGDGPIQTVLKGGQNMYVPNILIGGVKYYGYYVPLKNTDGSVVGMVFCGRASEDVAKRLTQTTIFMILVAIICVVLAAVVGMYIALTVSKQMKGVAGELIGLSQGGLKREFDHKALSRSDELGAIAESAKVLDDKLEEVIGSTKNMSRDIQKSGTELSNSADLASGASQQVSQAIDDISKGAVSQAESVQTAAEDTQRMGDGIDKISEHVQSLDQYAKDMKKSAEAASKAMEALLDQSAVVTDSVEAIGRTIDSTNTSAQAISTFTQSITDIAAQTNLLSLNASIEAARAGEAGRGFAVVADEIRDLADQSAQSAENIKNVVAKLLADAESSVEVMKTLSENFHAQSEQITRTQVDMNEMSEKVTSVAQSADEIAARVRDLNASKESLLNIVSDLSAVSEENAASTEETNASMQELNATFSVISESANSLQALAEKMMETINYFQD